MELVEFENRLRDLIAGDESLRPFICEGNPGRCSIFLVGTRPAPRSAARGAHGVSLSAATSTVAAVIEAERFHATRAVMLVHSFSPDHAWLDDYRAFARALGTEGDRSKLSHVGQRNNVELYLGWVEDRADNRAPVAAG